MGTSADDAYNEAVERLAKLDGEMPSEIGQSALVIHELYESYFSEDLFTSRQALYIVCAMMTGNPGQAPPEN